mmetsp:Transcript_46867/g.130506  ORF Transcript_46867/g.130506 Transcript_46867/m.130506 type:complete len:206 (-) Transcript_46867:409-1026(-)
MRTIPNLLRRRSLLKPGASRRKVSPSRLHDSCAGSNSRTETAVRTWSPSAAPSSADRCSWSRPRGSPGGRTGWAAGCRTRSTSGVQPGRSYPAAGRRRPSVAALRVVVCHTFGRTARRARRCCRKRGTPWPPPAEEAPSSAACKRSPCPRHAAGQPLVPDTSCAGARSSSCAFPPASSYACSRASTYSPAARAGPSGCMRPRGAA